jgi:hypothetical protein
MYSSSWPAARDYDLPLSKADDASVDAHARHINRLR